MSTDLTGTVALITGATSGIGKATAFALAGRGAHVLVGGRNAARGEAVVTSLRARGAKADFIDVDLGSSDSARELARRATQLGDGHVDILVNNAAIFPTGPTASMAEDDIDAVFAINVKVPFVLAGELAPAMARRGKGAIVNVGTMAAEFGMPGMSLYGASKAALVLLTKAWAAEFGPGGVRVNAVNPGPTRTEGTAVLGEAIDQFAALAPRPAGFTGRDRRSHHLPGFRRRQLRSRRDPRCRRRPHSGLTNTGTVTRALTPSDGATARPPPASPTTPAGREVTRRRWTLRRPHRHPARPGRPVPHLHQGLPRRAGAARPVMPACAAATPSRCAG